MEEKVNHPKHYNLHPSGIECITIIRHMGHNVGAAVKYLWRAGLKKDPTEDEIATHITDIRKAIWYLEDEIKLLQGAYDAKTTYDLFNEEKIPACIHPIGVADHCAYCGSHDHATNECPGQSRL